MTDIYELHAHAAERVREILARPMPADETELGVVGYFDPWDIFPALYGSYSSEFDACAIDVLQGVRDLSHRRRDLAADMLREMLCVADLCDYGTSPRHCFPTEEFAALLPALIERWQAHAKMNWGA